MVRTANANSTGSSPRKNTDNEWTTIPIRPKPLVSFPKSPAKPTLHMLLLQSYFPRGANKWIWNCYLDDEVLSPNPRGHERYTRIQKAFTKSGTFFAGRGIVLHSLNICTSRIVELFFGSEEDLWKADALAEEYSRAMAGSDGCIRRKENTGKMVCHGVYTLDQFTNEFVGRWNLKEERLRELEDMNPVFDSNGKRVLYRIRYVQYMSSQTSNERLLRAGATWAVNFSDFRVAECFIDGHAEFNFFMDPCAGGLKWYQENPPRFLRFPDDSRRSSGSSNGSGSAPGAVEPANTSATATAAGAGNRIGENPEGPVFTENPEQARSTLKVRVGTPAAAKTASVEQQISEIQATATALAEGAKRTVDEKPEVQATTNASIQTVDEKPEVQSTTNSSKQIKDLANVGATSTGQQEYETRSITTAPADGVKQAVITKRPETQVPTNTFAKEATNTATVKIDTIEHKELQPSQHLAKPKPTAPMGSGGGKATEASCIREMRESKPKGQPRGDGEQLSPPLPLPPPPYRKPIATQIPGGPPSDTLNKFSPLVPPAPSAGGLRPPTEDVKRQYPINPRRLGAKITPLAREHTSGSNGNQYSGPAAPVSTLASQTTTTKHPYRQNRQPNPRQNIGHKPAGDITATTATATATTATTDITDASAIKGGATVTSVDTSRVKIEKIHPPEVRERHKLAKLAARKKRMAKKRADKKAATTEATGVAGGRGGVEAKVEGKEVGQGVAAG
ncbi:unnamed protein product [Tuber aestivum]|uniref:Uncharacterized protein n=1 Tax=Tuber aestivum TaxID=59557 RepID=A0A292PZS2_9PEZI|nr:unnamed protein product [Tuber aestivum]